MSRFPQRQWKGDLTFICLESVSLHVACLKGASILIQTCKLLALRYACGPRSMNITRPDGTVLSFRSVDDCVKYQAALNLRDTPTGDPADHVDAGPARRHPGAGTLKRWPHPTQGSRRPRTRRPHQTGPGRRQPEALAPTPARDTTDPVHVDPTKRHPGAGDLKRWPPHQPGTLPTTYTPAPPHGTGAQAT